MKTITVYGILRKEDDHYEEDIRSANREALVEELDLRLFEYTKPKQYVIAKIEYTIEED